MNLSVIEMERPKAREKFLEYRRELRRRFDAEDQALMRGYRQLSMGRQLLRLTETIQAGGYQNGLPRLAICRADARWCEYVKPGGGPWDLKADDRRTEAFASGRAFRFEFWEDKLKPSWTFGMGGSWHAMVPPIPPALRPTSKLSGYHILFEATWVQRRTRPPGDPALLKRLGGDLFVVLGTWDLTDLERSVLMGRRSE